MTISVIRTVILYLLLMAAMLLILCALAIWALTRDMPRPEPEAELAETTDYTEEATRPTVMPTPTATHEATRPMESTLPTVTGSDPTGESSMPNSGHGGDSGAMGGNIGGSGAMGGDIGGSGGTNGGTGSNESSTPTDATTEQRGRNRNTTR